MLQNTHAVNAQYSVKNRAGVSLARQQKETQAALQSFAAARQAERSRHAEEQHAAVASAVQPLHARLAELAQELEAAHKKTEATGMRGIFSVNFHKEDVAPCQLQHSSFVLEYRCCSDSH